MQGPIGGSAFEVGLVTGAFAITGLACRPIAGNLADRRGRRPIVIAGALLSAVAGALYFIPAGVPGLVVARLFLGAGEGLVYTAGSAWVVDLAPIEKRGRIIGFYGLAIWTGLTLGPPIGELLLRASSFEMVWAFAMAAPLLGAVIALRIPETYKVSEPEPGERRSWIERKSLVPGMGLALGTVGFAAVAAFLVLHLDERSIGHGAGVFAAFAATVFLARLLGGWLPDRYGPVPCIIGTGIVEAAGLVAIMLAQSLARGDRRGPRDGRGVLASAPVLCPPGRKPRARIQARRRHGHVHGVLRRGRRRRLRGSGRGGFDRGLLGGVRVRRHRGGVPHPGRAVASRRVAVNGPGASLISPLRPAPRTTGRGRRPSHVARRTPGTRVHRARPRTGA